MSGKETITDQMICVYRKDFSESSLVLTFLSKSYGKIPVLAKGIKRTKRKTAGGIDMFDVIEAKCSLNKDGLSLLIEWKDVKSHPQIRESLDRWYVSLYFAELVKIGLKDYEPVEEVYRLMVDSVEEVSRISKQEEFAKLVVDFTLRFISLIGYKPELRRCVMCRRELTPMDKLFFSPSSGGMVCRDCEMSVFDKRQVLHRGWYYLLGKVKDVESGRLGYELLEFMIKEYLGVVPTMRKYLYKRIFVC